MSSFKFTSLMQIYELNMIFFKFCILKIFFVGHENWQMKT
jgi:hypothetical protein